ncbi:hypothetical protein E5720_20745 [Rhodococcus sp. PAMC28707]|uniref:hypothetical protein n=1 Tax=unclassified Rhodococcus (in: high G+C Gram-positive bacteria) TaxID=192944 RepID=UPI00109DE64B|nr:MULTISPECIES: hypothetical protein [unclassified Rhodococcus (in: high G+C Gram-positive bacteria)]QCB51294.1 hypothetical protein E5769_14780 [Rhodococcus sp. PAMC28705]QCB60538.1 hypothetical protein E5720_20745 [Rhodococcus sp. PAMC28707]
MIEPQPADVIAAVMALTPLSAVSDTDQRWQKVAAPTDWTAAHTVAHISDALVFYCGQVARRACHALPVVRNGRVGHPSEQLDNAVTSAHMLAGLLRDLGSERAWHPSGNADRAGWVAMAVTEILVHGYDAAQALEIDLQLPDAICDRTVSRAFPWVGPDYASSDRLLLAVTGRIEIQGVKQDPQWWWQSAPLQEWDGKPRQRTIQPRWS